MATAKLTGANLTLIRGRKYTLIHPFDRRKGAYQFEKGKPRPVLDGNVVEYARSLTETVVDGDGAEIQKPLFRISPLENEERGSSARRAAPVRDDEDVAPARRGPTVRARRKA